VPRLTQVSASSPDSFRLRACHALWIPFPEDSTNYWIGNSTVADPTTPWTPKCLGFGLCPISLATTLGIEVSVSSFRY
jgi:hypothetical protein